MSDAAATEPLVIGRYALFDELAAGGMAKVHLGRLLGPVGFGRTVAIKRLHAHYLNDPEFITMFMDEARIVARIRHPNVVPMADVVQSDQGLFLVMEYVHGESLSRLMRTARQRKEPIPPRIVAAILCGVLLGLHAAHDTKALDGALLGVVHRDVSPQNIIVGVDGAARVLDFGIAKAAGRIQVTRDGQIKGKLAYMAPEQIRGQVDRRTDVFAAAVVLWEMLAGRRLHEGAKDLEIVTRVVQGNFPPPSLFVPSIVQELDAVVLRGLHGDPDQRYGSAREMALELERSIGLASPTEVSIWVEYLAKDVLERRGNLVTAMELAADDLVPLASAPPPPPLATETHGSPPEVDAQGEVQSSSAVFAHTQTPYAPARRARPRPSDAIVWTIVGASAVMAIIGVGLGTCGVLRRSGHLGRPADASPSSPSSSALSGAAVDPADGPRAVPETTPPASATSSGARTLAPAARTPTGGLSGAPPTPLPPPANRAAGKPTACDPGFTVDEAGHRHYKPECNLD